MKKSMLTAAVMALAHGAAPPAFASYICTAAVDGKSVTVKVSNAADIEMFCSITCHFKKPGGDATLTCSKKVPASAKDFEICTRTINVGAKATFSDGNEYCVKP